MSKLLIHVGPPKAGSTQLQALLHNNSKMLSKMSIDYLHRSMKEHIRSYMRAYKKIDEQYLGGENALQPWYLNYRPRYFVKESSNDYAIISEEAIFCLMEYEDVFFFI